MINPAALATELTDDPLEVGYAAMLPDQPGRVAEILNAPIRSMVREKFVTVRALMSTLGVDGAVIAEKLTQFGALPPFTDPQAEGLRIVTKWAMQFIDRDGLGLDIGDPVAQQMIGALQMAEVLTPTEASALTTMTIQPASRAEELWGQGAVVTEAQIRAALE